MEILKSASKTVFVLMAVATIVGMLIGKIDAKDFLTLVSMAFTFYFANKGDGNQPFAGK